MPALRPDGVDEESGGAIDPLEVARRVVEQAFAMIPGAVGTLLGLLPDARTLHYVCGTGLLSDFVGERLPLAGSLVGEAVRVRRTLITHDTEDDSRVNVERTRAFGVRSCICVPLCRGTERLGALCVCASMPHAFGPRDVALLDDLADFVSAAVGAAADVERMTTRLLSQDPTAGEAAHAAKAAFVASVLDPARANRGAESREIEAILRTRDFSLVFQPIFNLFSGEMLAAEALARFPAPPPRPPDVWFAQADHVGLGAELSLMIIEAATAHLPAFPDRVALAINIGPHVVGLADIAGTFSAAGADPKRIVLELTEQVEVADYPRLTGTLMELRESGVRLAIDDTGAGFSSLMHVIKLAPDFIKLDRELTSHIDLDPIRQSLASSLVLFAAETGATIVAEGIETADELDTLRVLGIEYGQGYHLARPVAIEDLDETVERAAARTAWQAAPND